MKQKNNRKIRVTPWAAAAAVPVLLWGGGTGLWSLLAALLHETGHLLAMRQVSASVRQITIGLFGIDIGREGGLTSYRADLLIFAGGAAANLAAAAAAALLHLPAAFLWANLTQAAFCLLPLPILDGGGILRSFLCLFLGGEAAERVCFLCGLTVYVPLLSLSLYLLWEKSENPALLLLCVALGYSLFFDGEGGV